MSMCLFTCSISFLRLSSFAYEHVLMCSISFLRLPVAVDHLLAFVVVLVVRHARTPLLQELSTQSFCFWEQSCLPSCLPLA